MPVDIQHGPSASPLRCRSQVVRVGRTLLSASFDLDLAFFFVILRKRSRTRSGRLPTNGPLHLAHSGMASRSLEESVEMTLPAVLKNA
jgi:hypothetical protein